MSFVNKIMSFANKRGGSGGGSFVPDDSHVEGEVDDFDYSTINNCPYCREPLQGYDCVSCDVEFVLEDDKLVEIDLSRRGPRPERLCAGCNLPMNRKSSLTAAWEDGDNAEAYITCSRCGYQNPF